MKVVIGIIVLLVVLAGIGFVLPTEFAIAKSVKIDAAPAQVHEYVGELKKWDDFMPWNEEDPTMVTTVGEKSTGVGAFQSWSGKDGEGELTFTKCDPETGIAYDMTFINGDVRAASKSEMTYKKVDGGTEVSWTMTGDVAEFGLPGFVSGYMKLFMTSSAGGMFERGLGKLKEKVEAK